ncbi:MAG: hypothetical protein VKJ04_04555 [Vampirovibrionales bacterium]|nr:hypothetical protein [Vampirovibrionales bacterium]
MNLKTHTPFLGIPQSSGPLRAKQAQSLLFSSALPNLDKAVLNSTLASAPKNSGKLLKSLDFTDFAKTTANQVKLIYGMIILSRIAAAGTRSWNEVRETIVRDGSGFAFWLFTVPMFERLMLYAMDHKYQKGLVIQKPKPIGSGFKAALKKLNYAINPLKRWEAPTSNQIKDRMAQVLDQLQKQGIGKDTDLYRQTALKFKRVADKVNAVKGAGVLLTIAMLGFVLPLLNIAVTRKNVKEGKVGRTFPIRDVQHNHPRWG